MSLAGISTHWPSIADPVKFVLRYAPAIRGYLHVLLPQPADIDEVLQEILLMVLEHGLSPDRIRRGRFRDYLIATVRYRAWRHRGRKQPRSLDPEQAQELEAPPQDAALGEEWLAGWRQCLLDRALDTLERKQRQSPGNWHYTALKLATDYPNATSKTLAARVGAVPPLSAVAFRKQLSRARSAFARALFEEVERTLEKPTPEAVIEELADVGLLAYVRPYLNNSDEGRVMRTDDVFSRNSPLVTLHSPLSTHPSSICTVWSADTLLSRVTLPDANCTTMSTFVRLPRPKWRSVWS